MFNCDCDVSTIYLRWIMFHNMFQLSCGGFANTVLVVVVLFTHGEDQASVEETIGQQAAYCWSHQASDEAFEETSDEAFQAFTRRQRSDWSPTAAQKTWWFPTAAQQWLAVLSHVYRCCRDRNGCQWCPCTPTPRRHLHMRGLLFEGVSIPNHNCDLEADSINASNPNACVFESLRRRRRFDPTIAWSSHQSWRFERLLQYHFWHGVQIQMSDGQWVCGIRPEWFENNIAPLRFPIHPIYVYHCWVDCCVTCSIL